jgi:hypothetical protein
MHRLQPHTLMGLFTLLTLVLTGAALGRIIGLTAGEGAYLTALLLAFIGWIAGRKRAEERR